MKWIDRLTGALRIFVWLYLGLLFAVWLLLDFGGDRWWLATLMLFGPRWVYGVPLALLAPVAAIWQRRLLWPLAASAILVAGPIMGFRLPWARLAAPHGPTLRVLTCNLKGRCNDNAVLNELIHTASPDIVALQGCGQGARVAWPEGWHVCQQGEMIIASRYPLRELPALSQISPGESATGPQPNGRVHLLGCLVATPQGDLSFCTTHPHSPRNSINKLLSRNTVLRPAESTQMEVEIAGRWQDSEELSNWLLQCEGPRIIAGDLNLPPDSAIYRTFWGGYWNAFSSAGLGCGYTEWPRVSVLWFGIRIDHILSSPNWRPCRCWVGPDVGSDHLPLVADLVWVPETH